MIALNEVDQITPTFPLFSILATPALSNAAFLLSKILSNEVFARNLYFRAITVPDTLTAYSVVEKCGEN